MATGTFNRQLEGDSLVRLGENSMLNDEESAKLALSEAAKKVSDLKARQWEISKNAVVILAFVAAVFHGDLNYAFLRISNLWKYVVLVIYFAYFCVIFLQAFSNTNRYKVVYKKAAEQLYSAAAQERYFQNRSENMIEDEGRLQIFLLLVVVAFFALVLVQVYLPQHTTPSLHW
jgi:hypothetical protein